MFRDKVEAQPLPAADDPARIYQGGAFVALPMTAGADQGTASVSLLQRRLGVGYARAGRLVDSLERLGVISGHEGSKPRTVLIGEADIPRVLGIAAVDSDVSGDE